MGYSFVCIFKASVYEVISSNIICSNHRSQLLPKEKPVSCKVSYAKVGQGRGGDVGGGVGAVVVEVVVVVVDGTEGVAGDGHYRRSRNKFFVFKFCKCQVLCTTCL